MANSPMLSALTGGQPPWKKHKPSKKPTSYPSLPYDLIVSILARISRSYYPNLSLVSKCFRSILASPELFQTRTLLGCTETFLYVCLRYPDEDNPRWFILHRKPNQTLTNQTTKKKKKRKETSSVNLLAPISFLNSPPVDWSAMISVGHNLYAVSKNIENAPYSNVPFLDCRTYTWLDAPRMRLAHTNVIFEGAMYLPGSSEKPDSLNCVEVYNPKTQTWKPVPPEKRKLELENLEGKIYKHFSIESARKGLTFNFKANHLTSGLVGLVTDSYRNACCMIENRIYGYNHGNFTWKKFPFCEDAISGKLEGLEGLPKFSSYCTVKLVDCGGKLVVLWDKYVRAGGYKEKMIWCAEILLEKRNGDDEIWGKVEWLDAVLKVPKSYKILCPTDVTL